MTKDNENPRISIITVTYNAVNVLEKTIMSVINQTYTNYEYIIIDGKSNDGTTEIIKKYQEYLSYYISEPDNGIYDAMNKGIKIAKGEWLNFMNAGDKFASKEVLSTVFNTRYDSNTDFLYSDNYYLKSNGKIVLSKNDHLIPSILHQSSIYKKSLHKEHGLYIVTPKIIVSDFLFFCRLDSSVFKKIETIISVNSVGGISENQWCVIQSLCAKVTFRKLTLKKMILKYILYKVKTFINIFI